MCSIFGLCASLVYISDISPVDWKLNLCSIHCFISFFSWVFCVYKVCVYGNALVVATSALVVIVVEKRYPDKGMLLGLFFLAI